MQIVIVLKVPLPGTVIASHVPHPFSAGPYSPFLDMLVADQLAAHIAYSVAPYAGKRTADGTAADDLVSQNHAAATIALPKIQEITFLLPCDKVIL